MWKKEAWEKREPDREQLLLDILETGDIKKSELEYLQSSRDVQCGPETQVKKALFSGQKINAAAKMLLNLKPSHAIREPSVNANHPPSPMAFGRFQRMRTETKQTIWTFETIQPPANTNKRRNA